MSHVNPHVLPHFDPSKGLEIGIYSLGEWLPNPHTGKRIPASQRIQEIVEMAVYAEEAGLDIFQLGESHQKHFLAQAHMTILAAIAQATHRIKLSSGATIISTSDPVRVFEDAATIDLLSKGRMEIVAGRASRVGLFELLGYNLADYEALFEEKFALLLEINENERVTWEGKFRAPLHEAEVLPRPENDTGGLPIWRALGGSMESAAKAGTMGVPIYQAHLGGAAEVYSHRIQLFRDMAEANGYDSKHIPVSTSGFLYAREDTLEAYRAYYPHINEGMKLTNGQGFNKRAFAQGQDVRSIINVGDPQLIIDKILYQHELYNHQRYTAQIDFGGVPLDEIKRTIDILGERIVPEVKKYTARKD